MNALTQRRIRRLGIVTIATVLANLTITLSVPPETLTWPPLLVLGLVTITGAGLLFHARFARVLGVLGALVCMAVGPWALYGTLRDVLPQTDVSLTPMLAIANAAATTLLGVWLAARSIQVLAGRAPTASPVTTRIVGGTFAIVAVYHLWLAHLANGLPVGFSVSGSTQGIQVIGFIGWPVWNGALLLTALAMAGAPRRLLRLATTVFAALAFALVPLSIVAIVRIDGATVDELLVFVTAMTSLGAYLAWWLRDDTKAFA